MPINECPYCQAKQHVPQTEDLPQGYCAFCAICGEPGHIRAHPRLPVSLGLCERHLAELTAPSYHFELYHLIYLLVFTVFLAQILRWFL